MRVDTRKSKEPATWIPKVLELFNHKGKVTSQELAKVLGKALGGDALTRCRQVGIPLQCVGFVNGSKLPRKLYALDFSILWSALEEAVKQIDRYTLILRAADPKTSRQTYRAVGTWIERIRRFEQIKGMHSPGNNGSLHKTRPASQS